MKIKLLPALIFLRVSGLCKAYLLDRKSSYFKGFHIESENVFYQIQKAIVKEDLEDYKKALDEAYLFLHRTVSHDKKYLDRFNKILNNQEPNVKNDPKVLELTKNFPKNLERKMNEILSMREEIKKLRAQI